MNLFFICFFIAAFLFSFLINTLFLRFARTLGIRDKKETVIRWASTSKPAFGGISFYIIFLISLISYSIFFEEKEVLQNTRVVGILGTVTLAFLMGLADDAYNTRPLLKLFVQILCGVILCYSGTFIAIFPNMLLNYALTIVWVVGMMNSLNMLDNMDAIASIVSLFIFSTAAMLIFLSPVQNNFHLVIIIGIIGALAGFLIFNWNPSKLYMGDTGSQVLGLMLASTGIIYFWNDNSSMNNTIFVSRQIAMVTITFILPVADTTIVIINRLLKKHSPFIGGRDHTTHHLFFRGITEKKIAVLFSGIGFISLLLVYIIQTEIIFWGIAEFMIFSAFPLMVFLFLFTVTRIKNNIISHKTYVTGDSHPLQVSDNGSPVHAKKHNT